MKKLMSIALCLAASTSLTAFAHEGHAHKVMGTVVSITAEQIEVSNPEGKKETLPLTKETTFKKDKAVAAAKDVVVGARVVLSVVEKEGKKVVSEVVIGVASAPPASTKKPHGKH